MRNNFFKIIFATYALMLSAAKADEPVFSYIYTTDLNPKGTTQLEQKIDDRYGQAHGVYNNVKMQSEIEHGVTDNFQAALYINYSYINAKNNSTSGTTEGLDISAGHDPADSFHRLQYDSFATEFIYRILSPYKDIVGLAIYIEPEIGPRVRELESKIILHKNFLDDQLITAINITNIYETEKEQAKFGAPEGDEDASAHWHKAAALDFTAGVSYRFIPNWFGGIEYRNHNEFGGSYNMNRKTQEHTAHFIGPVIHYGGRKFFATLGFRYQIAANSFNDEQKANMRGGKIYGDEHTKIDGIRLILGLPL